jgi:catechol 2,3-dioxygenase
VSHKIDSLSWNAPLRIGKLTLVTRDLPRVAAFYEEAIGLTRIDGTAKVAQLGVDGRVLIELQQENAARRHSPREAGLFHTAFLLPTRADLAHWAKHITERKVPLQGASDHLVSEALYLADPEGNGIEVYADRPSSTWMGEDGRLKIATLRLNIDELLASATGDWTGAPADTFIGHVHLQAGDLAAARDFYEGALGYELMTDYPGADFYATGGYHHHLGANIWNSKGAAPRTELTTGLKSFEIVANDEPSFERLSQIAAKTGEIKDPWNTRIEFSRA